MDPDQQQRPDAMDRDSTMPVDHAAHPGRRFARCEVDLAGGLFLLVCAALAWWFGQPLKVGTAYRMGPGYAPMLLSWGTGALGLLLLLAGLLNKGPALESWRLKPIVLVLGAMLAFAATIESAGLFIASALAVLLAAAAAPHPRVRELAVLSLSLAGFACLLYSVGLQLPVRVFPW